MEETKHTPGPWKIGKLIVRPLTYAFNVYRTIHINGKTIAKVYGDQIHDAELIAQAPDLLAKVSQLQAFKDYTHKRLDGMGIPIDPESPHKAAGCRIGGRMDEVEKELASLRSENQKLKAIHVYKTDLNRVQSEETSELKAERQELVEALKEANPKLPYNTEEANDLRQRIKSLLDKLNPQK